MRQWIVGAALLVAAPVQAQYQERPNNDKPPIEIELDAIAPMMLLDERALPEGLLITAEFPRDVWLAARDCLRAQGVRVVTTEPPKLLIVPIVRTFRIRDMTLDSLEYLNKPGVGGANFSAPTTAYSLVRSDRIVVVERYRENPFVLRHEALHFMLWRSLKIIYHDEKYFPACNW